MNFHRLRVFKAQSRMRNLMDVEQVLNGNKVDLHDIALLEIVYWWQFKWVSGGELCGIQYQSGQ